MCGYAAAYGHSFCMLYCVERHVDMQLVILITITLASSDNKLLDYGDWTETRRSCFNVNFNILLKQIYYASVGK
jgi:hypothetical protein